MAERDDLFYKPHIPIPEREISPEITTEAITNIASRLRVPEADISNPIFAMQRRFEGLRDINIELKNRSIFLLNRTIENIDGYVGDLPNGILEYITELTGIHFPEDEDKTDSVYTIPPKVIDCIFRTAGYYDPSKTPKALASDLDKDKFMDKINEHMSQENMKVTIGGLALLMMVLKLAHVIAVHFTVGHLCAAVRLFVIKVAGKKIKIGAKIAKAVFLPLQKRLLKIVGYSCTAPNRPPIDCKSAFSNTTIEFKQVQCCSNTNIFMESKLVSNKPVYPISDCFKAWINEELGIHSTDSGFRVCSPQNAEDTTIVPTNIDIAKSKVVAEALLTLPPKSNVTMNSNVYPLRKSIENAEIGLLLSEEGQKSIDKAMDVIYGDIPGVDKVTRYLGNCFGSGGGYTPDVTLTIPDLISGDIYDLPIIEDGHYLTHLFDFLEELDNTITAVAKNADKVTISVANLAKWTSSRHLCCWLWTLVLLTSLTSRIIKTGGNICKDSDGFIDMKTADALRNELRFSAKMYATDGVKDAVQLLRVIKSVIDLFKNQGGRLIFLQGFALPLAEMWEMIKLVIANAISMYLDMLFGPLESAIKGIRALPEIRAMIDNECFGVGPFLDFLSCSLGNIKFGITNDLMKIIDFSIGDFVIMSDIYLATQKFSFLVSLSDLMGKLIDLIIGIKDCYDPEVLINKILEEQIDVHYREIEEYGEVMGDVPYAEQVTKSLMGQSHIYTPEEIEHLENMSGSVSSKFKLMGNEPLMIMASEVPSDIDMTMFYTKDGKILDIGNINEIIEKHTGITMKQTKEAIVNIVSILEGKA